MTALLNAAFCFLVLLCIMLIFAYLILLFDLK